MDDLSSLNAFELWTPVRLEIVLQDHLDGQPRGHGEAGIDLVLSQSCPVSLGSFLRLQTTKAEGFNVRASGTVKTLDLADGILHPEFILVLYQP